MRTKKTKGGVNNALEILIMEIETEIEALGYSVATKRNRKDLIRVLSEDLRAGQVVTDFEFDQVYPDMIRNLSDTHWTPVEVAIRAASLLASSGKTRILDVGSGCGKFCTIAALSAPGNFIGIEHRPHLREVAQRIAKDLGAVNASFIQGNMADLDWSFFDSFYLFNPFYEYKTRSIRIDDTVPMGFERFNRSVETVRAKLKAARTGTKVVVYHGYGGEMPSGYRQLKKEPIGTSCLELWVKMEMPEIKRLCE